jgi:hypothetical protein
MGSVLFSFLHLKNCLFFLLPQVEVIPKAALVWAMAWDVCLPNLQLVTLSGWHLNLLKHITSSPTLDLDGQFFISSFDNFQMYSKNRVLMRFHVTSGNRRHTRFSYCSLIYSHIYYFIYSFTWNNITRVK